MYRFLSLLLNIFEFSMKKIITFFIIFYAVFAQSQTDYSNRWEDLFSYNNVKDFVKIDEVIYALVDNALFTYNTNTKELTKISSVQGLSGETATAIHYNSSNNRIVIGYETGLIEVVDSDLTITTSPEITNFNQTGEKKINDIFEHNNKLYVATSFAIVVYDIDKLEFGDTYFIGANSSDVVINQITVFNDIIYATTPNGIYTANANNPNLIDFNNWTLQFAGGFSEIEVFNNKLFASRNNDLFQIAGTSITPVKSFNSNIVGLKVSTENLSVSLVASALFFDTNLNQISQVVPTSDFQFTLNNAYQENNIVFLATKEYGILQSNTSALQSFSEIHPQGPLSNDVFSLDVHNNNLWIVYGGFTATFAPSGIRIGYSHFNSENWINTRHNNSSLNHADLVDVIIDKTAENKTFISSFGFSTNPNSYQTGGLFEVENDAIKTFYNQNNSPLEDILPDNSSFVTVRISAMDFDSEGNLWMTNVGAPNNKIQKLSKSGQWSSFDISSVAVGALGMYDLAVDRNNTVWVASRKNGLYAFNETGNKINVLTSEPNRGNLPNLKVKSVAVDKNNRIWIGTITGLVAFNSATSVFEDENLNAEPIIIEEDGVARRLLGDQTINSIFVDGANNKWFGTDGGGALYTNPNGQKTLATFNKDNSPLPSNKIVKIKVDEITGKVYFATNKGVVVYNSKVAPFGNELGEVYAYPNPALKQHQTITISGRNGTHLPKGTNIKILDIQGNLVYETNVVEGEQLHGGKAVWNKKNLAGQKVASGVYIVLLATEDGSETSTTKIAIVN